MLAPEQDGNCGSKPLQESPCWFDMFVEIPNSKEFHAPAYINTSPMTEIAPTETLMFLDALEQTGIEIGPFH